MDKKFGFGEKQHPLCYSSQTSKMNTTIPLNDGSCELIPHYPNKSGCSLTTLHAILNHTRASESKQTITQQRAAQPTNLSIVKAIMGQHMLSIAGPLSTDQLEDTPKNATILVYNEVGYDIICYFISKTDSNYYSLDPSNFRPTFPTRTTMKNLTKKRDLYYVKKLRAHCQLSDLSKFQTLERNPDFPSLPINRPESDIYYWPALTLSAIKGFEQKPTENCILTKEGKTLTRNGTSTRKRKLKDTGPNLLLGSSLRDFVKTALSNKEYSELDSEPAFLRISVDGVETSYDADCKHWDTLTLVLFFIDAESKAVDTERKVTFDLKWNKTESSDLSSPNLRMKAKITTKGKEESEESINEGGEEEEEAEIKKKRADDIAQEEEASTTSQKEKAQKESEEEEATNNDSSEVTIDSAKSSEAPPDSQKKAEDAAAKKKAEEEAAAKKAEEKRIAQELAAKKKAEEEAAAKKKAEEEAATKKAEEERIAAELEAQKKAEDAAAKKKAEEEAAAKKAEEKRIAQELAAKKKAEEEAAAKKKAEEVAATKKAEEERIAAELEAQKKAGEAAAKKKEKDEGKNPRKRPSEEMSSAVCPHCEEEFDDKGWRIVAGKNSSDESCCAHIDCVLDLLNKMERSNLYGVTLHLCDNGRKFVYNTEYEMKKDSETFYSLQHFDEVKENWTHKKNLPFQSSSIAPKVFKTEFEYNDGPSDGREHCSNKRMEFFKIIKKETDSKVVMSWKKKIRRRTFGPMLIDKTLRRLPGVYCCKSVDDVKRKTFTSFGAAVMIKSIPAGMWFRCPDHDDKFGIGMPANEYCNAYMRKNTIHESDGEVFWVCYSCNRERHYSNTEAGGCRICNGVAKSHKNLECNSIMDVKMNGEIATTMANVKASFAADSDLNTPTVDLHGLGEAFCLTHLQKGKSLHGLNATVEKDFHMDNWIKEFSDSSQASKEYPDSSYNGLLQYEKSGDCRSYRSSFLYKDQLASLRTELGINLASVDETLKQIPDCTIESWELYMKLFHPWAMDLVITSSTHPKVLTFLEKYKLGFIVAPSVFALGQHIPHVTFDKIYNDKPLNNAMSNKENDFSFVVNALCNCKWQTECMASGTQAITNIERLLKPTESRSHDVKSESTKVAPCICCPTEKFNEVNRTKGLCHEKMLPKNTPSNRILLHKAETKLEPQKRYATSEQQRHIRNHSNYLWPVTSVKLISDVEDEKKPKSNWAFPILGLASALLPSRPTKNSEKSMISSTHILHYLRHNTLWRADQQTGDLKQILKDFLEQLRSYFDDKLQSNEVTFNKKKDATLEGVVKAFHGKGLKDASRNFTTRHLCTYCLKLCKQLEDNKTIGQFDGTIEIEEQLNLREAIKSCILEVFGTEQLRKQTVQDDNGNDSSNADDGKANVPYVSESHFDEATRKRADEYIEVIAERIAFGMQTFILSQVYDSKHGYASAATS